MSYEPFDPDYPIDALPPLLRRAAEYIQIATQAPIAMCATSVLAAVCACVHPRIFACWRPGVRSPASLFFVLEAESGERKSSNDDIAFREHQVFEERQWRQAKEDQINYQARLASWQAVRRGLLRNVEASVRGQGNWQEAINSLEEHEKRRPVATNRPKMLKSNSTPESLEQHLATVYPCACVLSKDGADAFTAGLFDKPSMLNSLWDNGSWTSDRIGRGVTVVSGASLCIHVQVQGPEFKRFISGRARPAFTSGHTARWLYCRPESTQGTRTERFEERPRDWITGYWARTRELLLELESAPFPPRRHAIRFSKTGRDLLVWYKDMLEPELLDGRRFAQMRGAAAKSPEMAARLAANIAKFLGTACVSAELVRACLRIAAWHLNQYRIRFCPYTEAELDVIALREWLDERAPSWVKRPKDYWWHDGPTLSQIVHHRLRRDVTRLKATIKRLEEQDGSVRLKDGPGRGWYITLDGWLPNPPSPEYREQSFRWRGQEAHGKLNPVQRLSPLDPARTLWPGVMLP